MLIAHLPTFKASPGQIVVDQVARTRRGGKWDSMSSPVLLMATHRPTSSMHGATLGRPDHRRPSGFSSSTKTMVSCLQADTSAHHVTVWSVFSQVPNDVVACQPVIVHGYQTLSYTSTYVRASSSVLLSRTTIFSQVTVCYGGNEYLAWFGSTTCMLIFI